MGVCLEEAGIEQYSRSNLQSRQAKGRAGLEFELYFMWLFDYIEAVGKGVNTDPIEDV